MGHDQRNVPLAVRNVIAGLACLVLASVAAQASDAQPSGRCGFGHSDNVKHASLLRAGIASTNPRPQLPFYVDAPSGRFRVHFSRSGSDAVPSADADGSGLEDYVEETLRALDSAFTVEVTELGFAPPPSDLDSGGSAALDVYLRDLAFERETGLYGVTRLESIVPRPNAWDLYTTFIEIDNDFSPTDRNAYDSVVYKGATGIDALRVTCAHELHHAVQVGTYGFTGVEFMVYEMTSTWMEQRVYPEVYDWHLHTSALLRQPSLYAFSREDAFAGYAWGWFGWVLHEYSDTLLRHTWTRIATGERPYVALTSACRDAGTSLSALFCQALPSFYRTGSRGQNNRHLAGADVLPEVRLSIDERAQPPSLSVGNAVAGFGIDAIRCFVPGINGAPVSTTLIVSNPDEAALTQRQRTDLRYNVLFTSSPATDDPLIGGSSWGVRIAPLDRVCFYLDGQRTVVPSGPYPQPFIAGSHDALRFPISDARPGDAATIGVRSVGYGQPTWYDAVVEFDDDKLVVVWPAARTIGTGIYFAEVRCNGTTTVHKIVVRR